MVIRRVENPSPGLIGEGTTASPPRQIGHGFALPINQVVNLAPLPGAERGEPDDDLMGRRLLESDVPVSQNRIQVHLPCREQRVRRSASGSARIRLDAVGNVNTTSVPSCDVKFAHHIRPQCIRREMHAHPL